VATAADFGSRRGHCRLSRRMNFGWLSRRMNVSLLRLGWLCWLGRCLNFGSFGRFGSSG